MQVEKNYKEICFETGYQVLKNKGIAIIGMSVGNSYFKVETINNIVEFVRENFCKTFFWIPYEPTVYTFKGIGYDQKKAEKKAKLGSNTLINHTNRAINGDKNLIIVNWANTVINNEEYKKQYRYIYTLYKQNSEFFKDANTTTKEVLSGKIKDVNNIDEGIALGVNYLLEELAFLLASPKVFETEQVTYMYHRNFEIFEKLVNGKYDGIFKPNIGFLIVH